jgi:hypothetical protein
MQPFAEVQALDKRTGKRVYVNESAGNSMQYHALEVDARAGKIELIGYQMKITFSDGDGRPGPNE